MVFNRLLLVRCGLNFPAAFVNLNDCSRNSRFDFWLVDFCRESLSWWQKEVRVFVFQLLGALFIQTVTSSETEETTNFLLYRDYVQSAERKLIFLLDSFNTTLTLINTLILLSGYERNFNANYSFKVCLMLLKVKAELAASPPPALIISLIMSAAGKTSLYWVFYLIRRWNLQSAERRTCWT